MATISKTAPKASRDIHYYRQRLKNRVFGTLVSFFAEEAERRGLTKRDIAASLGKDPAIITRIFREPANLTLETISDVLLAMGAEPEPPKIVRFEDRATPNDMHPLMAKIMGQLPAPSKAQVGPTRYNFEFSTTASPTAKLTEGAKLVDELGTT